MFKNDIDLFILLFSSCIETYDHVNFSKNILFIEEVEFLVLI